MQTRRKIIHEEEIKEVPPSKDESDLIDAINEVDFEVEHASSDDDENSTKPTAVLITDDQVSDECKSETSSDYSDPRNHFDEAEEIASFAKQ